jgi:hypothetical protein
VRKWVLILLGLTTILFLVSYYTQKGASAPLYLSIAKRKKRFVCFQYKYTGKIAVICNKLQNTQKFYVFLALYLAPFYVLSKGLPSM